MQIKPEWQYKKGVKMLFHEIKHKIIIASIVFGTTITSANANGIPVLDLNSLKQSLENYKQQIKDYEEQIRQGMNQVQQMAEQGIGMQIDEILGQAKDILNDTIQNLDFKLPDELFQETTDVTNACAFLEQESEEFAKGIEEAGKKLSNQVSTCMNTVTTSAIDQTIGKLTAEYEKLMQIPEKVQEAIDIKTKISNITQAAKIVTEQTINNGASKINLMLEAFENGDKENPYSKEKMNEDIKKLAEEIKTPQNQKQAAAKTNALLIKLLESSQRNYEASLQFYKLNAEHLKSQQKNNEKKYDRTPVKAISAEDIKDIEDKREKMIYNSAGFPDFEAMRKQYLKH